MGAKVGAQILGREAELAELARLLDSVADGPAALLLEGEAGIGKTTLWRETLVRATDEGFRILSCGPGRFDRELPFAAVGDLLDTALDETLPALPIVQRRALEVALLRAEPDEHAADQRAVSVAMLAAVRMLASSHRMLLAIDDANWLDPASARVLEFTIRRLDREQLAVLVTLRRGEGHATPLGLDRALPDDRFRRLVLSPLGVGAIDRLLRARLDAAFLRPTLMELHRISGGNPLFALELGRALLGRQEALDPGEPLPVPDNLRAALGEHLGRLPADARETLRVVAAVSDPTVTLIEQVVGPPAAEHLSAAAAEALVEIDGDRIRLAHPLLAAAVYSELSAPARARLHLKLAERVTGLEERARHLARGVREADESIARTLDEAALRARARGAPEAAAELSEHARRLTPADAPTDGARRAVEAAEHHLQAGDTVRARVLLEETVAQAPPGDIRASALLQLARVRGREESHPLAVELLKQASREGQDVVRATAELDLTVELLQSDELARADEHAKAALELAETLGEPGILLPALTNTAMVDFLLGRGLRRDLQTRAIALLKPDDAAEHPRPRFRPEFTWAVLLKWADEFEPARLELGALLRRAREQHEEGWIVPILFQLGELECWFGNWEPAGRYADEARETTLQIGSPAMELLAIYLRALVDAHLGQIESARAAAEQAAVGFKERSNLRHLIRACSLLGFIALSVGDAAEARTQLGSAAELSAAAGYGDPSVLRFAADYIEGLVGTGELELADTLTRELEKQGRALDRPWALATSARCRALVCAARGEIDEALRSLDKALTEHERLLQPFEFARTLLVLGNVRRRARQKRQTREALEQALEIFERLGAPLWAAKARDELGRIGGRAPAPAGLTPTEQKIAELVAGGATNPEIAETLFMSRKTVETHLTHIFRKLEVRSRRELARVVANRGIPTDFLSG